MLFYALSIIPFFRVSEQTRNSGGDPVIDLLVSEVRPLVRDRGGVVVPVRGGKEVRPLEH